MPRSRRRWTASPAYAFSLAVIKYFELRNERVLVLCPKKLRGNWTVYQAQHNSPLNPFVRDRFAYTVLSHTDLSRDGGLAGDVDLATLNWGNYDLVVIDKSHNLPAAAPPAPPSKRSLPPNRPGSPLRTRGKLLTISQSRRRCPSSYADAAALPAARYASVAG
jgi:hypothetical protein